MFQSDFSDADSIIWEMFGEISLVTALGGAVAAKRSAPPHFGTFLNLGQYFCLILSAPLNCFFAVLTLQCTLDWHEGFWWYR